MYALKAWKPNQQVLVCKDAYILRRCGRMSPTGYQKETHTITRISRKHAYLESGDRFFWHTGRLDPEWCGNTGNVYPSTKAYLASLSADELYTTFYRQLTSTCPKNVTTANILDAAASLKIIL